MAASLHSLSLTRQTLSLNHSSSSAVSASSLLAPISLKSLPKLVPSLSSTGNYSQPISSFVRHVAISSDFEGFDSGPKEKLKRRGNSAITAAAKKENKPNKKKKEDSHSFNVKPNEATGPFPEALLLRERKVEEDGRLMPEFEDVEERELFEALNLQLESDMDADRMRHYEVVYLIHEDHKDEVENVNTKVREFVEEKKGRIWRFNDWGMRRLAYKIQKAKNAHYILMNFEVEAKWINDFKSMLDRDERVIRHLVMKQDKAETKDCPPPPEFHSLHGDMTDDADEDDDEEYDDEDYGDEDDEGVVYVDEVEMSSDSVTNTLKPEKVGR